MPIVSVIMPAYNCKDYISEAIESILIQTFSDFEFIIIDDASTDETFQIICSFSDPRIRIYRNNHNRGIVYCLNEFIPKASGKYIARMDADDIALPDRLELQVRFMEENDHIGVLGTWVKILRLKISDCYQIYPISPEENKVYLLNYPTIVHSTALIRKSLFDQLDLIYDHKRHYVEEYELWTRLVLITNLCNLPKVLLYVRKWENSTSAKFRKQQQLKIFQIRRNLYQSILDRPLTQVETEFISEEMKINFINLSLISKFLRDIKAFNKTSMVYNEKILNQFLGERILGIISNKRRFSFDYFLGVIVFPFLFPFVFFQKRIFTRAFRKIGNRLKL